MIQKYVMKPAIKNRGEAIITQSKDWRNLILASVPPLTCSLLRKK
jgi:hypothetical protein